MGVSRLIRPAETTLDRHFVVSLSRRDSIASSSWQCISHFDIIVRIRMLRKECDIVWGNRTEFTFARRRPEQTHKTTYLLYRYCQGIRHALHHCRALWNRKRRALRVHLPRPAFLPLKRVFPLHQSELSSFHETESPTAARALLRHRCRSPYSRHRRQSLCLAGNRCPK